jgi:uncharacterized membrane-anchored protein YjiN (DUF445 family)
MASGIYLVIPPCIRYFLDVWAIIQPPSQETLEGQTMTTFQANKEIDEAKQRAALRKMQRLATVLLVGMAILFVIAFRLEKAYPIIGLVRAFSEAAIVGALADWFAVVALFRHPFNLPIPHTAIIQEHKDRFGKNLAIFIKNNFLARETLEERLRTIDMLAWLGEVFTNQEKVHKITEKSLEYLLLLVKQFDDREFQRFSAGFVLNNLQKIRVLPLIGDALTVMMKENKHQALLNEALVIAANILEENEGEIREKAKKDRPWYIPGFINEMIFKRMRDKLEGTLSDIQSDPEHDIRKRFDEVTAHFIDNLKHSEVFAEKANAMGNEFLANPAIKGYLENLWSDVKTKLMTDLMDPGSEARSHLEKGIHAIGKSLMENKPVRDGMNRWIYTSLADLAEEYVDSMISIISDTVKRWDAVKTSQTIEMYVGKDLQWIRINGTIVGGLVGLLIYTFSLVFK